MAIAKRKPASKAVKRTAVKTVAKKKTAVKKKDVVKKKTVAKRR